MPSRLGALRGGRNGLALEVQQLADAGFGEIHHGEQAVTGKCLALGGGLHLDETAVFGHDQVHIDFGLRIFLVSEIEEDGALDDADAGGGDELPEGRGFERAGGDHAIEGDGESSAGSGDGRGARTAVGLEDVAIEDDGALAERLQIDDSTQGAADEALDLMGAAPDFAALGLAGRAGESGTGQHAVLGGNPAAATVAEPGGNALLHGGIAENAGVPSLDENGAFGDLGPAWGEAHGAQLVRRAAAAAKELFRHGAIVRVWERQARPCGNGKARQVAEEAGDGESEAGKGFPIGDGFTATEKGSRWS